jgi:hypothetical protein
LDTREAFESLPSTDCKYVALCHLSMVLDARIVQVLQRQYVVVPIVAGVLAFVTKCENEPTTRTRGHVFVHAPPPLGSAPRVDIRRIR